MGLKQKRHKTQPWFK